MAPARSLETTELSFRSVTTSPPLADPLLRPPGLELEEKDPSGDEKAGSWLPASSRFSGEAGGAAAAL